ncbi:TetR/AcrR family transcriptional regulator C-terminal domain-containing protein [Nocardia sp. 2]|uniref:TetR/AcrR family transcriptional regulator C-terminal domain-containing protein n=1 Tax=Nocardia acididurans TaxID=2802282 RepID=A0ABS1MD94_9NOCA|nr:TetR/AcrR family transcriptional regulator [Nocardia acididurans]MBL1078587.1 TetR/AcrR family transcriptional regulator C-terminal domain-containing protein [Nocardia acididurans]
MPDRTSIWLRAEKPARGRPALDRDRIVAAAVTLLDEESISGLTMRKLADRLGVPAMTLYGYVANKEDVLEYAVDAVFAETLHEADSGDWRGELTSIGIRTFEALLRHHWAAPLVGGTPPLGPAAVAQFATIVRVLTAAGFHDEQLDAVTTAFYYYVLGAALAESAWARAGHPAVEVLSGYANTDAGERFRRGLNAVLEGLRPH